MSTVPINYRLRADLFRVAARFSAMTLGVRVEPLPNNGGALLIGANEDAVMIVRDSTGIAATTAQIVVPYDFVEAAQRAVKTAAQPALVKLRVSDSGIATCDGVGITAARALRTPFRADWRNDLRATSPLPQTLSISWRRDVVDAIGESARFLSRAVGVSPYDAERARFDMIGVIGDDLVVDFPAFPDALAIMRGVVTSVGGAREGRALLPAWALEGVAA